MTKTETKLVDWFARMPVVAILRGVRPEEAVDVGEALYEAGIGIIEVALNSPQPLRSIGQLRAALSEQCVLGAGTVVSEAAVDEVAEVGGEIIVAPNTNPRVIQRSVERGLVPMPGWASATELFTAYEAGARYMKLFPAASYGPTHVKAVTAVLPADVRLLAVGGVGAETAAEWLQAGITGFGIGNALYTPGASPETVHTRAKILAEVLQTARNQ